MEGFPSNRNHLHAMVTNTLRFGPKPELSNAWIARGDIDIEEILRVILKSVGPVIYAPTEIIVDNIMECSIDCRFSSR
jgi:hypothetical protein